MKIEVHGHQLEVTEALHNYTEEKLQRLGRRFEQPFEAKVQLSIDKPNHRAEGTLTVAGRSMHAEASEPTMYAAIDVLADKLDRALMKVKERDVDARRRSEPLSRQVDMG